jgi:hypothetical protein
MSTKLDVISDRTKFKVSLRFAPRFLQAELVPVLGDLPSGVELEWPAVRVEWE